jgi:HEAT repeat protein
MGTRILVFLGLVIVVGVAAFLAIRGKPDGSGPNRPTDDASMNSGNAGRAADKGSSGRATGDGGTARVRPQDRLKETPPSEPWAYLMWAADGPFVDLQYVAIEAMASLDDPRAAGLVTKYTDPDEDGDYEDEEIGMHVLHALAAAGRKVSMSKVEALLDYSEEDWDVEEWAARTAGRIPGDASLKLLLRLAVDDDENVRGAAGLALAGAMGVPREGTLVHDAIKGLVSDDDDEVAATAAGLLVSLGDADAAAAVERVLEEEDEDYDAALARGLGIAGNANAVPWLERLLAREDSRIPALMALGATKLDKELPRLKSYLGDGRVDLRAAAASAIALGFGAEAVDDEVRQALVRGIAEAEDPEVRVTATKALASVAIEEDRGLFEKILANPHVDPMDEPYRQRQVWAAWGLIRLGKK